MNRGTQRLLLPVSPRGSGDARVRVLWATDGSDLQNKMVEYGNNRESLILNVNHPLAQQAFASQ